MAAAGALALVGGLMVAPSAAFATGSPGLGTVAQAQNGLGAFAAEDAAAQTLTITGLRAHYHQDRTIELTADADPAAPGGTYQWFMKRVDQADPVIIGGQAGATLSIPSEQALNGAEITAKLLGAGGAVVATAEAVTIVIDDHGAPASQVVTVSGLRDHYHTGSTAELTAEVAPASVLTRYEWQVKKHGETDWTTVPGENAASYSFTVAADLAHAEVRAVLTFNDGRVYVTSEPVEIEIDDHHHDHDLTAGTPVVQGTAKVGKKLTANPGTWEPEGVQLGYRWLRDGKSISQATRGSYTLTAKDAGKRISVRVTGTHDGESKSAVSKATKKVAKGTLKSNKPKITGTAKVGKKLIAKVGGPWKPSGVKYSYRWYADGEKISKATAKSYRVAAKQQGKKITVKVTGKKAGYTSKTVQSSAKRVR
ncbi:MAG: hypothetical protein ACK5LO_02570 [Leucobacter sp.]